MTNLNLIVLRALLSKKGWHGLGHMVTRLYAIIKQLHEMTESDVAVEAVRAAVEVQLEKAPQARDNLLSMLELVDETIAVPEDQLQHLVRKFIERSKVYALVDYAVNNVEQEDFDVNALTDLVAGAVEVGERVDTAVTDLFATSLSGAPDNRPVRLSLGVSRQLDASLRGGTGPGELCLYLAPPATGKTTFLIQSGAAHAREGGAVLHVTMEINTRKVIERYDQAWTGLSSEDLQTDWGQARAGTARHIVQKSGGQVHIVDWSYMPATAQDVGAMVRKLRGQGINITMVVVDYLALMSPNKPTGRELRSNYSAVGKEMRAVARHLDLPVLSAWQVNRQGSGKSNTLLSKEDVSESWDIIMIADTIIGLNQNPEELRRRTMRLNVLKQRESTARDVVEIYCDLDRLVVRDLSSEDHFAHVRSILHDDEEAPAEGAVRGASAAESTDTSG
jgi:replicative DNA helicase